MKETFCVILSWYQLPWKNFLVQYLLVLVDIALWNFLCVIHIEYCDNALWECFCAILTSWYCPVRMFLCNTGTYLVILPWEIFVQYRYLPGDIALWERMGLSGSGEDGGVRVLEPDPISLVFHSIIFRSTPTKIMELSNKFQILIFGSIYLLNQQN